MRKSLFFALLAICFCLLGFTKEEAAKILKEKKIEVNDQAFKDAYNRKDVETMDLLIDAGINANIRNDKGFPLFVNMIIASDEDVPQKEQCKNIAIKMIQKGADVNAEIKGEYSPLMYASMSHAYEIIELMIKKGVNVNFETENHETALLGTLVVQDVKMAKILLNAGAKKVGTGVLTTYTPFEEHLQKTGNAELISLLHTKENKVKNAAKSALWGAGILGFLFGGFTGIFQGLALLVLFVILGIFGIGMIMIFMGGLFGAAANSIADSKKFSILTPFEKFMSLFPAFRKTLQEERRFKAKMDAKYPKPKQTETKE